jgi:hypothetical protein
MTAREYALAHDLGYAEARQVIQDLYEADPRWRMDGTYDREDVDDRAFPHAFEQALEALPQLEAADISDPVHTGVSDAYDAE